eukprot:TRINITY_DN632_c0_g1_i3.p1 TRINITY_DN632_c0_g1~~TRINITY_DN632_c0_g1_i3.p1  ORF type:complete len:769 (+),score=328.65 TRINITY_DN632_c0_g1_i3:86-2308(+)
MAAEQEEEQQLAAAREAFRASCAQADQLARWSEEGAQHAEGLVAMYQHLYDARAVLEGLRQRLVQQLAQLPPQAAPRLRRWLLRHILKLFVQLARNHTASSEAAEGYQHLDRARAALQRQRRGEAISADDLAAPQGRQSAAVPCFEIATDPGAAVSLANVDLLLECVSGMGAAWSGWGDQDNAMRCFETAEAIGAHWQRAAAADAPGDEKGVIGAIVADSQRRAELVQRLARAERERQMGSHAAKLAEKRRRRGLQQQAAAELPAEAAPAPAREEQAGPAAGGRGGGGGELPDMELAGPDEDEREEVQQAMEVQYTVVCNGLAQLHRFNGGSIESCHYCHCTLQRQLEGNLRGQLSWKDWVVNCVDLCDYYATVRDLSHAQHCLAAAELLLHRGRDADLDRLVDFQHARWNCHAAKLMRAEAQALAAAQGGQSAGPPSLDGVTVRLFLNPHYPPPPEDAERLAADPDLAARYCARKPFKLPVPPPAVHTIASSAAVRGHLERGEELYRAAMEHYTLEEDCEKHIIAHLELDELLGVAQYFHAGPQEQRLELGQRRLGLLQRVLEDGLDELVFRNVLRQVHFSMGTVHQEAAEALIDHGHPPERFTPHLRSGCDHFAKFSERFLHEFREMQKVKAPVERSALLRLDGSDAPAYVVGEMRHAKLLSLFPDAAPGPILAKYKGIVRFIDTNAEACKEYPQLPAQAALCREMIKLMQGGLHPAAVARRAAAQPPRHADPTCVPP